MELRSSTVVQKPYTTHNIARAIEDLIEPSADD